MAMDIDSTQLFDDRQYATSLTRAERFKVPPLSVLDTKQGYWRARYAEWTELGLATQEGRADGLTYQGTTGDMADRMSGINGGTSVFDPVLTEALVRWYSPEGGQVIDPFAGGPVRGLVAGMLGRRYLGQDLNTPQINANRHRLGEILNDGWHLPQLPVWHAGDSSEGFPAPDGPADMILTCPPYGDLEVYGDQPGELSRMAWFDFCDAYTSALMGAASRLAADRFACIVVGNFRDKGGKLRDLVGATTDGMAAAGLEFYSDAVLLNMGGSAPMRASAHFGGGRKLTRLHQYVLVYVKGDWRAAAAAAETFDPATPDGENGDP